MPDVRTGYHYTSLDCWKRIQKVGLRPYPIHKPQLRLHIGREDVQGVWVWVRRPVGLSHIGCLLYQMSQKNTVEAVMLEVHYDLDDVLSPLCGRGQYIELVHQGTIEHLEYHDGRDVGVIMTKTIPVADIKLLKVYNLLDAWKAQDE